MLLSPLFTSVGLPISLGYSPASCFADQNIARHAETKHLSGVCHLPAIRLDEAVETILVQLVLDPNGVRNCKYHAVLNRSTTELRNWSVIESSTIYLVSRHDQFARQTP